MLDLEAIELIKQLKARYFRFLDTANWEGLQQVFTDDAIAYPSLAIVIGAVSSLFPAHLLKLVVLHVRTSPVLAGFVLLNADDTRPAS